MHRCRVLLTCLVLGFFTAGTLAPAAEGVLYFNRVPTLTAPITLHRANADGTGEELVPVPLPSTFNPTVSRDGRRVLLTSGDPGRPFKLSNNVFAYDLVNGAVTRITQYEDLVQVRGVLLTNDVGSVVGDQNVSGYSINYPFHKAFSPDGSRVVTINLQRVGSTTTEVPRTNGTSELFAGSYRAPIVEVHTVGNPLPLGQALYLGDERTGFNQGGDGVDWHPTREEVVATVRSDIPATSNNGVNVSEGTLLAVFASGGLTPFLRKLTSPVGEWFSYVDLFTSFLTAYAQHDYAPAIAPDGTKVAYVRHTQRLDTRVSLGPLSAICEIRVINYDGTGDHRILQLTEGLWVTHLAWSPDGTEIALDLAPQVIQSGWPALIGDATRSEIHVVRADGTNPHPLIAAPASHPAWAPGRLVTGGPPVEARLERVPGGGFELRAVGGQAGETLRVETSDDLVKWTRVNEFQQTAAGVQVPLTDTPGVTTRFFRLAR